MIQKDKDLLKVFSVVFLVLKNEQMITLKTTKYRNLLTVLEKINYLVKHCKLLVKCCEVSYASSTLKTEYGQLISLVLTTLNSELNFRISGKNSCNV